MNVLSIDLLSFFTINIELKLDLTLLLPCLDPNELTNAKPADETGPIYGNSINFIFYIYFSIENNEIFNKFLIF